MPKGGSPQPAATEKQAEILAILKAHPEGRSVKQIARELGEKTSIIRQRINYVSASAPIFDEDGYFFLLDRKTL